AGTSAGRLLRAGTLAKTGGDKRRQIASGRNPRKDWRGQAQADCFGQEPSQRLAGSLAKAT
ncbi:MAG: hypothetical protein ABIX01_12700, partial [Chitinophagaceae bacterium]